MSAERMERILDEAFEAATGLGRDELRRRLDDWFAREDPR